MIIIKDWEEKLKVNLGDFIQISNPEKNLEVTGYVYGYSDKCPWIKLSTEHFLKFQNMNEARIDLHIDYPDYNLAQFTNYEILKKAWIFLK